MFQGLLNSSSLRCAKYKLKYKIKNIFDVKVSLYNVLDIRGNIEAVARKCSVKRCS